MSLVESQPWQSAIVDAPPLRLDYQDLTIPENVHLTLVVAAHSSDSGLPYYMEDVLKKTDVFMPELTGWYARDLKLRQRVAKGDFKSRQKLLEANVMEMRRDHAEWAAVVYKALFGSRVRVAMVDYPAGHHGIAATQQFHTQVKPMTSQTMPHLAARDKFVLNKIVTELTRLRQDPQFEGQAQVRALALFGVGHLAIHDGFAAAIAENDVDSTSQLLFERGTELPSADAYGVSKSENDFHRERIIRYQNWLRTPDS